MLHSSVHSRSYAVLSPASKRLASNVQVWLASGNFAGVITNEPSILRSLSRGHHHDGSKSADSLLALDLLQLLWHDWCL